MHLLQAQREWPLTHCKHGHNGNSKVELTGCWLYSTCTAHVVLIVPLHASVAVQSAPPAVLYSDLLWPRALRNMRRIQGHGNARRCLPSIPVWPVSCALDCTQETMLHHSLVMQRSALERYLNTAAGWLMLLWHIASAGCALRCLRGGCSRSPSGRPLQATGIWAECQPLASPVRASSLRRSRASTAQASCAAVNKSAFGNGALLPKNQTANGSEHIFVSSSS